MMNRSENKAEDILNSLDGIKRATARPFMYTRVMAKMQEDDVKSVWGKTVELIARPAVALACLTAVIATNVFFVIKSENSETETITATATSVTEEFLQNENMVLAVNNFETSK